jgi:hypothetical protein
LSVETICGICDKPVTGDQSFIPVRRMTNGQLCLAQSDDLLDPATVHQECFRGELLRRW